jgi:hypothetical protein
MADTKRYLHGNPDAFVPRKVGDSRGAAGWSDHPDLVPTEHTLRSKGMSMQDVYWDGPPIKAVSQKAKEVYGIRYMDDQRAWEFIQPYWLKRRGGFEQAAREEAEATGEDLGYVPTQDDVYWHGPPLPVDWERRAQKAAYAASQLLRCVHILHNDLGHRESFINCPKFACEMARKHYEQSGVESWKAS